MAASATTVVKLSAAPQQKKVAQEATLEIFQSCDSIPGRLLLGTFKLKGPMKGGAVGGDPPAQLKWKTPAHPPSCGIAAAKGITVASVERAKSADQTLRSLGGKDYRSHHPSLSHLKGGYSFAPGDTGDAGLTAGGAGVKSLAAVQSAELEVGGKKQRLCLAYPKDPGGDWLWGELTFRLSFTLHVARIDDGGGEDTWDQDGPQITFPAHEFTLDASRSKAELQTALKSEYGNPSKSPPLHARDFSAQFAGSSPICAALSQACRDAAAFVSGQIAAGSGLSLSVNEVAVTMMSEGAVLVINEGIAAGTAPGDLRFDGYGVLGIDSFVTRWKRKEGHLQDYTSPVLLKYIQDNKKLQKHFNEEQDHPWETFKTLNLEESALAVAAIWTWAKETFAADVADPAVMGKWATRIDRLPDHVQYFWTTVYFNSTHPRHALKTDGLSFHDPIWDGIDDGSSSRDKKYNANWRTASYRLFCATNGL